MTHHSFSLRRIRRNTGIVLGCLILSGIVFAQERSPSGSGQYIDAERGLSIEQLVAMALDRSPVVLGARSRAGVARGERNQAALRPNPSIGTEWREQAGGSDRLAMIGLSWPLDLFAKSGRVGVADARARAVELEVREVERQVASGVRMKTLEFLAALQQLEVRQQVAAALLQFRDLVAARAESGAAPPLERDISDLDAKRAQAEILRQRAVVESRLAGLRQVVGLSSDQPLVLRATLEELAQSGASTVASLELVTPSQLASERPDIQAAETRVEVADAALNLIRREAKPAVSLTASYMRMRSGFQLFGTNDVGVPTPIEGVFHNVSIGAMVTVPWRNRRQGDLAAASAQVQVAQHDLEARRLTAGAEISAARARFQRLSEALAIYTGEVRNLATRNVEVVRQSYQLGRATLLDVLNETRRLLETETAYTDVLADALRARSDLMSAMGVIR